MCCFKCSFIFIEFLVVTSFVQLVLRFNAIKSCYLTKAYNTLLAPHFSDFIALSRVTGLSASSYNLEILHHKKQTTVEGGRGQLIFASHSNATELKHEMLLSQLVENDINLKIYAFQSICILVIPEMINNAVPE